MRLDRWLWWTRLAKTRAVAQQLAEGGTLRIDGRRIERAHCPVRVGDTLTYMAQGRIRVVRVAALPVRRGPAFEAQLCYAEFDAPGCENVSQDAAGD